MKWEILNLVFFLTYLSFARVRSFENTDEQLQKISPNDRPSCKQGATASKIQVNTTKRLKTLRDLFNGEGIEAYYILSGDEHQSEFTSEYDKRIQYISGFSGSNGKAVVFADRAALWTDGRYFLQAEKELDCNWILMRLGEIGVPNVEAYVISIMKLLTNKRFGADPFFVASSAWVTSEKALKEGGVIYKEILNELIDQIWTTANGRIPKPSKTINALPMKFAGKSWENKIMDMHKAMEKKNVDVMIITGLDEIAWLFNLRGTDVPYNPFFISYATLERTNNRTRLYLIDHIRKISEIPTDDETYQTLAGHLNTGRGGDCGVKSGLCVEVKEYNNKQFLADIDLLVLSTTNKIWISYLCSYAIYSRIPKNKLHEAITPVQLQKSQKNVVETQGMINANVRDAAALIKFVAKLEKEHDDGAYSHLCKTHAPHYIFQRVSGETVYKLQQVQEGKRWTEISAAEDLKKHRLREKYNRGRSFPSISSSGPNGAVIHYFPNNITARAITVNDMYLLDSGGQYLDGTTDVTRTFHFGTPSTYQKECYTRVLMGQINLAMLKWPSFLYGRDIDAIARRPLWDVGLRYRHSTGHGIGAYLSVHEGPGSITMTRLKYEYDSPLKEFQFFSDEPGYYEPMKFGIRLENIIYVKKANAMKYFFPGTIFLEFETITLVPYEPKLILYNLLSEAQINWLNKYLKKTWDTIGPLVKDDERAYRWLQRRVMTVTRGGINHGNNYTPSFIFILLTTVINCLLNSAL